MDLKKHTLTSLALLCVVAAVFGCASAPSTNVRVLVPAASSEAAQLRQIAVLPFDGPQGREFATQLESKLTSIRVDGQPYFRVVERSRIDALRNEIRFSQSGNVTSQEALRLGQLLGVKALYVGVVEAPSTKVTQNQQSRSRCAQMEKKKCVRWAESSVTCQTSESVFAFTPKLVEVETGRIVYSNRIGGSSTASACPDGGAPLPSQQEMIATARGYALDKLATEIAPSSEVQRIRIIDSFDDVQDEASRRRLAQGAEFAKGGRMDRACEIWREMEAAISRSMAFVYDLGVCHEIDGNLVKAEEYYRRADRMLDKPDSRVSEAIARVAKRREDAGRMSGQMGR